MITARRLCHALPVLLLLGVSAAVAQKKPQLNYLLDSAPFPLQASTSSGDPTEATLTLVVSNPENYRVKLYGLSVTLPVGTYAADLAISSSSIDAVASSGWSPGQPQLQRGAVTYTFCPKESPASVAGEALEFQLENVPINSQAGVATVTVLEGTGGNCPSGLSGAEQTINVSKFHSGWGDVTFTANPTNVPPNGTTTLNWFGPQGATYELEYIQRGRIVNVPDPGKPALAYKGSYQPAALAETTTFTLTVEETKDGETYSARKQVVVSVTSASIEEFSGTLRTGNDGTFTVTLSWSALAETTFLWASGYNDQNCLAKNPCSVPPVQQDYELTFKPTPQQPFVNTYTLEAFKAGTSVKKQLAVRWAGTNHQGLNTDSVGGGMAISTDGTRIYLANSTTNVYSQPPPTISVIDVTGEMPKRVESAVYPDSPSTYTIFISAPPGSGPNGPILMSGSNQMTSDLWKFERKNGSFIETQHLRLDSPFCSTDFAVSADGSTLWVAGPVLDDSSPSSQIAVVDAQQLTIKQRVPLCPSKYSGRCSIAGGIASATDKSYLAVPVDVHSVILFDVTDNQPDDVYQVFDPRETGLEGCGTADSILAFSPGGKSLAVSCRFNLAKFDLAQKVTECIKVFYKDGPMVNLAFSPDGSLLFGAIQNAPGIRVFDAVSFEPTQDDVKLEVINTMPLVVAQDGSRVFVAGGGGSWASGTYDPIGNFWVLQPQPGALAGPVTPSTDCSSPGLPKVSPADTP